MTRSIWVVGGGKRRVRVVSEGGGGGWRRTMVGLRVRFGRDGDGASLGDRRRDKSGGIEVEEFEG